MQTTTSAYHNTTIEDVDDNGKRDYNEDYEDMTTTTTARTKITATTIIRVTATTIVSAAATQQENLISTSNN